MLIEDVMRNNNGTHEVDPLLRLNIIRKPSKESGPLLADVVFRHEVPVERRPSVEKEARPKRPRWRRK